MVELPALSATFAALMTRLPLSLVAITPLLVTVPLAFRVNIVALPLTGASCASAATVKLPLTSMVTLAVANAVDKALAVDALITMSSGSSNHIPALPDLAVTSTTVD